MSHVSNDVGLKRYYSSHHVFQKHKIPSAAPSLCVLFSGMWLHCVVKFSAITLHIHLHSIISIDCGPSPFPLGMRRCETNPLPHCQHCVRTCVTCWNMQDCTSLCESDNKRGTREKQGEQLLRDVGWWIGKETWPHVYLLDISLDHLLPFNLIDWNG